MAGDHTVGGRSRDARVPGAHDRADQAEGHDRRGDPEDRERRAEAMPEQVLEDQFHCSSPLSRWRTRCARSAACGSCVTITMVFLNSLFNRSSSVSTSSADLRRSEEHTSELQSQSNLVCRLLLEKKKKN